MMKIKMSNLRSWVWSCDFMGVSEHSLPLNHPLNPLIHDEWRDIHTTCKVAMLIYFGGTSSLCTKRTTRLRPRSGRACPWCAALPLLGGARPELAQHI